MDQNMVKVLGRILSPPRIEYGNRNLGTSSGNWNLREQLLFKTPKPLHRWQYLAIRKVNADKGRLVSDARELKSSMAVLIRVLNSAGIQASELKGGKSLDITGPNDRLLSSMIKKAASEKLDILFVILPETDTLLYNTVKKLADITWGVQTICVVGRKENFYRDKTQNSTVPTSLSNSISNSMAPITYSLIPATERQNVWPSSRRIRRWW